MTVVLTAFFGMANASTANWYGYALYSSNEANWQNHFVSFNMQDPATVHAVSEALPTIWAATYLDGYVWFVTTTRSLCKAPINNETHTIGDYETVLPILEPYNVVIDMAYNPRDGMMYYLCQDSQYNSYLRRSNLATPSEVELIGSFSVRMWTLAINNQGRAYGVAYEGGNLYEIDLNNAATTLVGSTGKEVWYTQSMAFDLDTNELLWAQFATINDHGLYQVNTETAEVTSLGEIGQGSQLAGLFMVPENIPPDPEIISEIYVEGFTEPVWGEHPDFSMTVAADAHYSIDAVEWFWSDGSTNGALTEEDAFNNENLSYFMILTISPEEGYYFTDETTVFYDGDPTPSDASNSYVIAFGKFLAKTISYQVTDITCTAEQTVEPITTWPNPTQDLLHLNVMDGAVLSVFDMTGRLVMKGPYESHLDVSHLAPGVYTIKAEGVSARFVKE